MAAHGRRAVHTNDIADTTADAVEEASVDFRPAQGRRASRRVAPPTTTTAKPTVVQAASWATSHVIEDRGADVDIPDLPPSDAPIAELPQQHQDDDDEEAPPLAQPQSLKLLRDSALRKLGQDLLDTDQSYPSAVDPGFLSGLVDSVQSEPSSLNLNSSLNSTNQFSSADLSLLANALTHISTLREDDWNKPWDWDVVLTDIKQPSLHPAQKDD